MTAFTCTRYVCTNWKLLSVRLRRWQRIVKETSLRKVHVQSVRIPKSGGNVRETNEWYVQWHSQQRTWPRVHSHKYPKWSSLTETGENASSMFPRSSTWKLPYAANLSSVSTLWWKLYLQISVSHINMLCMCYVTRKFSRTLSDGSLRL